MGDVRIFVTRKEPPNSADPYANTCWCHGERDTSKVGDSYVAVSSETSDEILEFCPKFFAELLQVALGLHMGALQGNIDLWPLVNIDLKKEEKETSLAVLTTEGME